VTVFQKNGRSFFPKKKKKEKTATKWLRVRRLLSSTTMATTDQTSKDYYFDSYAHFGNV
jgi:hypothetical protein